MNEQLLYSRTDTAKLLGISIRTLTSLVRGKKIRGKRIGRKLMFSRVELDRFVKGGDVAVVDPARGESVKEART